MLLLTSTSDVIRVVTSVAANSIDCHVSWVDLNGTTVTPGRQNTVITTATTTTVVPSPGAGTSRNIKGIYITNDSTGTSCTVAVEHFDGTNQVELMQFILLPGENMNFNEEGGWRHRDAQGAEYPPMGIAAYSSMTIPFFKNMSASDGVGYWYASHKDTGFPSAWSPGTPGVNGRVTDGRAVADVGCIPIPNPVTGANYLTEVQMASTAAHTHLIYDVLWCNTGLSVTSTSTVQAISPPTLPARDINGTTNGEGCMIGLYFLTASTLAAVNALSQVTYTNSDGTTGRIATLQSATIGSQLPATPVIGTLAWYSLAAGDKGVRAVTGFNIGATSWLTGTISLFVARDIATLGCSIPNVSSQKIIPGSGVRIYNNSCLLHGILSGTSATGVASGEIVITER